MRGLLLDINELIVSRWRHESIVDRPDLTIRANGKINALRGCRRKNTGSNYVNNRLDGPYIPSFFAGLIIIFCDHGRPFDADDAQTKLAYYPLRKPDVITGDSRHSH